MDVNYYEWQQESLQCTNCHYASTFSQKWVKWSEKRAGPMNLRDSHVCADLLAKGRNWAGNSDCSTKFRSNRYSCSTQGDLQLVLYNGYPFGPLHTELWKCLHRLLGSWRLTLTTVQKTKQRRGLVFLRAPKMWLQRLQMLVLTLYKWWYTLRRYS